MLDQTWTLGDYIDQVEGKLTMWHQANKDDDDVLSEYGDDDGMQWCGASTHYSIDFNCRLQLGTFRTLELV